MSNIIIGEKSGLGKGENSPDIEFKFVISYCGVGKMKDSTFLVLPFLCLKVFCDFKAFKSEIL